MSENLSDGISDETVVRDLSKMAISRRRLSAYIAVVSRRIDYR